MLDWAGRYNDVIFVCLVTWTQGRSLVTFALILYMSPSRHKKCDFKYRGSHSGSRGAESSLCAPPTGRFHLWEIPESSSTVCRGCRHYPSKKYVHYAAGHCAGTKRSRMLFLSWKLVREAITLLTVHYSILQRSMSSSQWCIMKYVIFCYLVYRCAAFNLDNTASVLIFVVHSWRPCHHFHLCGPWFLLTSNIFPSTAVHGDGARAPCHWDYCSSVLCTGRWRAVVYIQADPNFVIITRIFISSRGYGADP